MILRTIKFLLKTSLLFFLSIILLFTLPRLITGLFAKPKTYEVEKAPSAPVAIVFGAGLQRDGTPTAVLQDRVKTATELYFAGKVQKILMSGDNRFEYYNEPEAMYNYAINLGVPEQDIIRDFAGRSTYDTCYRARDIFQIKEALLVTQRYHLPRALFTCNILNISANGIVADQRNYSPHAHNFWTFREYPATLAAFFDLWISKPVPVLGKPEPIIFEN